MRMAAAVISWPACGIDTPSEVLMSVSVPGTTITPVPMTKLPTISAHRTGGNGVRAEGVATADMRPSVGHQGSPAVRCG